MKIRKSVAIVPIRGGSKGYPKKNILNFAGLPLYEHAVLQGIRCCKKCVVTTDIESVLSRRRLENCILHKRPDSLATDSSSMDDVLRDAINSLCLHEHIIVLLQATSPLRCDEHVELAMQLYDSENYDLVLTATAADRSILKYGTIIGNKFNPVSNPEFCFSNRQSLPDVFKPNGAVYVFSGKWFIGNGGLSTNNIGAVVMPELSSLDIDSEADFIKAEELFIGNMDTK